MEILLQLFILLLMTRLLGEVAVRVGQPAIVGELIGGILLAAAALHFGHAVPFLARLATGEALELVANLGIFFLVLLAGIEMKPREIAEHSTKAFAVALGGALVPLAGGFALAWLFLPAGELKQAQALLVGVALSVTSIPVTVRVFTDLGLLHSRVGETVLAAAIFDDVISLFLLAILTGVMATGNIPDWSTLLILVGKISLFFAITLGLGIHVYPGLSRRMRGFQGAAIGFSALMGVALAYGILAEILGMHWIIGVFLAGLYFEPNRVGRRAYRDMRLITMGVGSGFLAPLFFAYIGLRVDLSAVTGAPLFLGLLIAVAFFGKLVGAGLPALWAGLDRREALAVGVGMSSRGAVELIIIGIAYDAGLFAQAVAGDSVTRYLYSNLILMAVITTLAAPILLRWILGRRRRG